MKTIQKTSALLAVLASLSMAGVIDIYTSGKKQPSTSLNLTTIDSLTFSGKGEKKVIDFSGKAKQKAIKLSKIDQVKFSLKDKSKETMTVTVGEGVMAGEYKFKLSEIKKIEIVEMDAKEDADGDGLTDLEEIYKYDTNPNSVDTDGDGWSDGEELADGMYSSSNPTKFNPRIADVPGLRVTLKKTPSIKLNITTSEGKSKSETISKGSEVSNTNSTSYEESRSTDIMSSMNYSATVGAEVGLEPKIVMNVTVGYNESYTSSTGMTWGASEEKSVAESYEKALAEEKSKSSEVSGATLCMQVELKNTSDIAFTIEALKLSASMYDIKDSATLKILADLSREGDWSDITLKPAKSVQANFCNNDVKVELIEELIYNTSSIVLGSSTQKITIDGGGNDFTVTYTKVVAKTADVTIDYGPDAKGDQTVRYQVATNYRYNPDNKGSDDMYAKTSLADLLRNAHVDFKQDSVKGPSKKKLYGLASIDGYKYNLKDSAMWYVSIQRAKDLKKGRNTVELYTLAHASYDLEKIFVGAGDAVHIFYNKDQDHDGVPLFTEHLFGTDDKKADSDGDGLSDYDEINGWTKGKSKTKIYTNPANADTDDDGLNDKEDSEPTKRILSKDATLSVLQVFADSLMTDSSALLSVDSANLAKGNGFSVFVHAPYAYIKLVPNAKKVAWVRVTDGETMQYAQSTVDGNKKVFIFRTPGEFSVFHQNKVKIEVKSEDEAMVKTYTLFISSSLIPPTNLRLGKAANRTQIIVNFDHPKDSRVKGYVILRGGEKDALPENIEKNAKIKNNSNYKGFKSILVDADQNSYVDSVGDGSPYYTYRVYAYSMEGDSVMFSTGTEQHKRSVGRIYVHTQLKDFGGEYYYYYFADGNKKRSQVRATVSLHDGGNLSEPIIRKWEMFDCDAGKSAYENAVVFLSEVYDDKCDEIDTTKWGGAIGRNGLFLYFDILSKSDKGDVYEVSDQIKKGIYWKYENMAKVLMAEDGIPVEIEGIPGGIGEKDFPKKGVTKYIVGKGGIGVDTPNDACGCGDEPHTGYIIWFDYEWMDDNDFY